MLYIGIFITVFGLTIYKGEKENLKKWEKLNGIKNSGKKIKSISKEIEYIKMTKEEELAVKKLFDIKES